MEKITAVWDDRRVSRGMAVQLAQRRARLDAGEKPLGWKLAFGAPAALERLGISGPLVGYLSERAKLPSGTTLAVAEWTKPLVEPEIAIYLGKDLPGGGDRDAACAAIAALGPALELADVARPQLDIEETLCGNINQRNVVLGLRDESRARGSVAGLVGRLRRNGAEVAVTSDPEAMTGDLIGLVRHVADLLCAFGETLRSGQIIIAGSIMPPVWIEAGEEVVFTLDPIDTISVRMGTS